MSLLACIWTFSFGIFDLLLLRYVTYHSCLRECTSLCYWRVSTDLAVHSGHIRYSIGRCLPPRLLQLLFVAMGQHSDFQGFANNSWNKRLIRHLSTTSYTHSLRYARGRPRNFRTLYPSCLSSNYVTLYLHVLQNSFVVTCALALWAFVMSYSRSEIGTESRTQLIVQRPSFSINAFENWFRMGNRFGTVPSCNESFDVTQRHTTQKNSSRWEKGVLHETETVYIQ